jgi:hypothetical protein
MIVLLALTACRESIGSVESYVPQPPPKQLVKECEFPTLLPMRELSQRDVENYWIEDRGSLLDCKDRFKSLKEFYIFRDSKLTGVSNE